MPPKSKSTKPTQKLTPRLQSRLATMNKRLYPAKLRWREDSGKFFIAYRRKGRNVRKVLSDDLELAYEQALLIRKSLDEAPVVSQRQVSLEQWYDRYAEERYGKLSPKTVQGYKYAWGLLADDLKSMPLVKITKERAEEVVEAIPGPGARKNAGVFLAILLNAAVKASLLDKAPYTPHFETRKRTVPVLSVDQLTRLCNSVSKTAQPAVILASFCGARRGEIMALLRSDIDLDSRLLYITKARIKIYEKDAGIDEIKQTKTKEPRIVPIPEVAIDLLRPHLENLAPDEMMYPIWREDLDKRLAVGARRAGLPKISIHGLRHVAGSRQLMEGGPAVAQALLGHRDISTTVDTYGHLTAVYLQRQVDCANLSQKKIARLEELARKNLEVSEKNPPKVAEVHELASLALHFWHKLAQRQ